MSEQWDTSEDSVFGGEMTQMQFYNAEFRVSDEQPEWITPSAQGIPATIYGQELILSRFNTKVYFFGITPGEMYGEPFEADYSVMSHIYIHRGQGFPPIWVPYPEYLPGMDEEEYADAEEGWMQLACRLTEIGCEDVTGSPKDLDFEQFYNTWRGTEPLEDVIRRIIASESE